MDSETIQKIIAEERNYGIDYEQIEKRFYFVFDEENLETNPLTDQSTDNLERLECIFIRPGFVTPSQKEKVTEPEELRLRILGAELIHEAGYSLKLPWYAIATAQAIFHRFYFRKSFLEYDIKDIVMASVFLATKVDECIRKVRDVVTVCYHVFKLRAGVQKPVPVLNLASNYYFLMRQAVVDSERIVLKELGFELQRLTDHCQKYLIYYLKAVRVPREVAQKAWGYANDCYKGPLCVHYPPNVLAASCIYLAIWTTNTPMPRVIWWAIFEASIKHIMDVCADILRLYEQPKTTMEDLRVLMNECFKRNNIEMDYVADNEEGYEKEQQERERLFAQEQQKIKEEQKALESQKKSYPPKKERSKSRSRERRKERDYRSDFKKKKRRTPSRERKERRRTPSSSVSESAERDRKKKKKQKKEKRRSVSSSQESRRKRSSSRSRKEKKKYKERKEEDRKYRDKRDRSRERDYKTEAPKPAFPADRTRERMSSLERLNVQIKQTEQLEREKHTKELEKVREATKQIVDVEDEGLDSFLKKGGDKKLAKSSSMSISLEPLKSAALGEKKEEHKVPEVVNINIIKSASQREEAPKQKIQPEPQPVAAQGNGHKELDEDEAELLALKQKIQEMKRTKKKY